MDSSAASSTTEAGEITAREEPFRPVVLPFRRRELAPLLADWSALAKEGSPFTRPEYFFAVARHMSPGEALFFGAMQGDKLVGALPLARKGRSLVPLASDHTPRFDYVGDPRALDAVWKAMQSVEGWDMLELLRVPADSVLAERLPELVNAAGGHGARYSQALAPQIAIEGLEERLSKKFKTELRRTKKKLEGLTFERVSTFDRQALADAYALEQSSWKGSAGTAIACEVGTRRFYDTLARHAARRGELTLAFLKVNGRRVAMHFALEADGVYYLLKPAYHPDVAAFGPGQLLMNEVLVDMRARRLRAMDLLGHDDAWKRKWTETMREHVAIMAYRPTLGGHARYAVSVLRSRAGKVIRALRARQAAGRRVDHAPAAEA